MNRIRHATVGRGMLLLAVCVLALPAWTAAEETDDRPVVIGNDTQQKLWSESLALLGRGRIREATEAIHRVATESDASGSVRQVDEWLESFQKLEAERQERIRADYDRYVNWVKEDVKNFEQGDQAGKYGWWRQAMLDVSRAYSVTMDEDAFRREPWLQEVVNGALKAAQRYEESSKWLKAASIYARLNDIFPLNKDYRSALKRCQSHIRLELTYTPESEWENEVNSIVPDMAIDAFHKIKAEYLRDVQFKELVVEALAQILRLAKEPAISKVFPAMKDKDLVDEFVNRVGVHLKRAESASELDADDLVQQLNTVLRINKEVKLLPENVLVYEFVQGAFHPLDTFTDMIWPANIQEFQKHTQGKFSGVGIQIRKAPGDPILVISPLMGSPAYEKGIWPGDLITRINGERSNGYTINRAVREITGRVGTTVKLTIKRPETGEEFEVELERREIKISTIKGIERINGDEWNFMLDPDRKIAYMRMTNFTDECVEELKNVLTTLVEEQGMRGLIFDLRGNPGGPLKAAVQVSEMFLPADKKIVSTKGRKGSPWSISSKESSSFAYFPMIVLVSPSSASASEIVSGALQVHNRALIVGERTFGKGSVQQVFPLNNNANAYLKLTTSRYYLPNDRCLHRDEDSTTWGVDPDFKIKLVPKEDVKINQLQLKAEILKGKNQKELSAAAVKNVTEYRAATKPASATTKPAAEEVSEESEDGGSAEADEDAADDPKIDRPVDENNYPEIDAHMDAALLLMRVRLESRQPWPTSQQEMAAKPATPNDG